MCFAYLSTKDFSYMSCMHVNKTEMLAFYVIFAVVALNITCICHCETPWMIFETTVYIGTTI